MSNTIWVVAEHHNGEFESITLELLGKAKQLGGSVAAVVLGSGVKDLAGKLGAYGAEKVYVADHAELANYRSEVYGTLLAKLVEEHKPGLVLFGATALGSDLASHTGAHLKSPVASNASNLMAEGGGVKIVRPVYGGNAFATLSTQGGGTVLVTVEAKSFEKAGETGGSAEVVEVAVDPAVLNARVQIKQFVEAVKSGKIPLNEAEVVVAGGRGVGGADKFAIIEELAAALGAAVGASRAVTDAGWRPVNEQIGQTGVMVKPKLYIAAGISGAVQHWVGMKESGYIVAINTDPEAPIMKVADLAIVGDLFKVIPEMIKEIKAAKGVPA